MARRLLITGAAGFVGRHLLAVLAQDRPGDVIQTPAFDVTDAAATRHTLAAARPDACIHLAAIAAIPAAQADPDAAWRVNLHGTLNVARILAEVSPGATLVFASTADAYGRSFRRGVALDEDAPLAPMNTYGATKAAADLALGSMAGEALRILRVRPFNHTGAGQSAEFVVPAFARQIARIEAGLQDNVLRVGALDPLRDFLDVRDVCAAYALCLARDDALASGTILNIASGTARRIGAVLEAMIALSGATIRVVTDPARLRAAEIPTASGDPGAAARLLGWTPRIPWPVTLATVLDDWRARVRQDPLA